MPLSTNDVRERFGFLIRPAETQSTPKLELSAGSQPEIKEQVLNHLLKHQDFFNPRMGSIPGASSASQHRRVIANRMAAVEDAALEAAVKLAPSKEAGIDGVQDAVQAFLTKTSPPSYPDLKAEAFELIRGPKTGALPADRAVTAFQSGLDSVVKALDVLSAEDLKKSAVDRAQARLKSGSQQMAFAAQAFRDAGAQTAGLEDLRGALTEQLMDLADAQDRAVQTPVAIRTAEKSETGEPLDGLERSVKALFEASPAVMEAGLQEIQEAFAIDRDDLQRNIEPKTKRTLQNLLDHADMPVNRLFEAFRNQIDGDLHLSRQLGDGARALLALSMIKWNRGSDVAEGIQAFAKQPDQELTLSPSVMQSIEALIEPPPNQSVRGSITAMLHRDRLTSVVLSTEERVEVADRIAAWLPSARKDEVAPRVQAELQSTRSWQYYGLPGA